MRTQLCWISVEFVHFLMNDVCSTKEDPLEWRLNQMIIDGKDFNSEFTKQLQIIREKYIQTLKSKLKSNEKKIQLSAIYNSINAIQKYEVHKL